MPPCHCKPILNIVIRSLSQKMFRWDLGKLVYA
uniref:Uncharacterized protein n=1 Tax=Siphoviridae sp. ctX926 TaxID=2826366 RepID=A0A8S5M155_9CAUD|nr:MAG TPA: hypothetical protein [Siphoviridae sp. ctX926]